MCLSKAYADRNGDMELLMEDITFVRIEDGKVLLGTLFGAQREIGATIKEIDFLRRSILLENLKEEGVSVT